MKLVILSGGVDSSTCLALAKEKECGKRATCLDKIKAFRDNGIELV